MKSKNHSYIFIAVWAIIFLCCSILSAIAYPTDTQESGSEDPESSQANIITSSSADKKDPASTSEPAEGETPPEPQAPVNDPYESLTYSAANAQYLIYVDAGHGWYDNGSSVRLTEDGEYVYEQKNESGETIYVTESGKTVEADEFEYVFEKNINFELAKKLKKALEKMGYTVGETRPGDNYEDCPVSLVDGIFKAQRRTAYVNQKGATYLISLHCNTYSSTAASGARLYYYHTKDLSRKLAENLQLALQTEMNHDAPLCTDNLAITRESAMPSVLIESGFITNHDDLNNLLDSDWQDQFVCALAKGIDADLHAQTAQ